MYKIDGFIINLFQEVYNVLWNQFGITKGLIITSVMMILAVSSYVTLPFVYACVIIFGAMLLTKRSLNQHNQQRNSNYTLINLEAEFKRTFLIYVLMRLLITGLFLLTFNFIYLILILWLYFDTCLVKTREPPKVKTNFSYGV